MRPWFRKLMKRFLALIASLLLTHGLLAQGVPEITTVDPIAPQPVPRMVAPEPAKPAEDLPEASGDKAIILEKLEGIAIYAKPDTVRAEGFSELADFKGQDGVMLVDLNPPDQAKFMEIARALIGKPVSIYDLNNMLRDFLLHYRKNDFPVAEAYMPEQAIQNGIVQVVFTLSVLGEVRVEGQKYFKEKTYKTVVRIRPEEPLRSSVLEADVDWLNNNPFRAVDLVYEKGLQRGTTDIILKTSESRPVRSNAGLDDTGNDLTGDLRVSLGSTWGNVFNWDHQLGYQYYGSPDFNAVRSHSGNYTIPLPWRHIVTVSGSYGYTNADFDAGDVVGSNIDSTGASWDAQLEYGIPLTSLGEYKHQVSLAYAFKQSSSRLLTNGSVTSSTGTPSTDISQFTLSYAANNPDKWGGTSFEFSATGSPGDMTSNNTDEEFYNADADGASYWYAKLTADRNTTLPFEFSHLLRGTVQYANQLLLGSEKLGIGGSATVRGYDEREGEGDTGCFLTTELRTPPVGLGEVLGFKNPSDKLQFLVFWDYGSVFRHSINDGAATGNPGADITMMSVGPGVRYSINPWFSARFDYGWQMIDTGVSTISRRDYDSRGHFSLSFSY
jgi:hemolysin activation/secretion protein